MAADLRLNTDPGHHYKLSITVTVCDQPLQPWATSPQPWATSPLTVVVALQPRHRPRPQLLRLDRLHCRAPHPCRSVQTPPLNVNKRAKALPSFVHSTIHSNTAAAAAALWSAVALQRSSIAGSAINGIICCCCHKRLLRFHSLSARRHCGHRELFNIEASHGACSLNSLPVSLLNTALWVMIIILLYETTAACHVP